MIQNIQFHDLSSENPNTRLTGFIEVCNTIKYNGVTEEVLRLRLLPLSLGDKAKHWLTSQPPDSITSWNDLVQKLPTNFFPPSKIAQLVQEINTFRQSEGENLSKAWDRFHELVRRCPHHRLARWMQVHTFYNSLSDSTKTIIDASVGGALIKKTTDQANRILEDMAAGGADTKVLSNLVNHVTQLTKCYSDQPLGDM